MPITEISNINNFFQSPSGSQKGAGGAGFAAALANADKTQALKASHPLMGGGSALLAEYWPERFQAKLEHAADKLGTDVTALKEKFATIVDKAVQEGSYSNPKAFLNSLSKNDIQILQMTHGVAESISQSDIDGMTEEGALNLMLPPGAQRDWNRDALYTVGEGHSFRFPTDSTPTDVRAAWEETTAGMTMEEKMLAEGHMLHVLVSANIKYDSAGKAVGIYGPGDAEFTNPFGTLDYSAHMDDQLAYLEAYRGKLADGQYERDKAFWDRFSDALEKERSTQSA